MKIAQIIPNLRVGGAEIMCENLVKVLKEKKHNIIVISLYNDRTVITDRLEKIGVKIYFLGKKKGIDVTQIFKLVKVFGIEKPDVVHAHLYASSYAMIAATLFGCKTKVLTIHSLAQKDNSRLGRAINRLLFSKMNVVPVALNETVKETVVRQYKLNPECVPVVYNGIDLSNCIIKTDYDFGENYKILHVGRFSPVKNHDLLINAFSVIAQEIKNVKLILVGAGELLEIIQKKVFDLGLIDRVEFMGQQENVYQYYHEADVFVLPSVYEGMPMSIIEAMGTGLPVIASKVGGIIDMIDNDVNGVLIEPSIDELVKQIVDLYKNKKRRISLGKEALIRAKCYSADNMAFKYLSIYEKGLIDV